jgi:hypothetical protein
MIFRPAVVLAVSVAFFLPHAVVAQAQPLAAELRTGSCQSPQDTVAVLDAPVVAQGEPTGAASGITAATSYSEAPASLDSLLATEHVVTILQADDVVACGEIGGVQSASGSLAIVLSERNDSAVTGVAFLAPAAGPAITGISLFLNPGTRDGERFATEAQSMESTAASGTATNTAAVAQAPTEAPAEPTPTEVPTLGTEDNPATIGTPLVAEGLQVTPLDAYFSYGYGFSTPKGGYTYLVVDVQMENVGDSGKRYSSSDFSGRDADTDAGFDSVFVLADGMLDSGDLDPGEYVSGTIVLEVQETSQRVLIKFDPNMFTTNDAYWIVG